MTDYRATPKQWAQCEEFLSNPVVGASDACILELRARVEALEGKYETMRLATLEWGKDVENLQRWSDQHLRRIEKLEEEIAALLRPNHPAKPDSSLVKRVVAVIADPVGPEELWHDDARAAIREVAAWLSRQSEGHLGSGAHWAKRLQREAER